jgi:RNA polymerase sigma-70 factor (ECF subfamily)
VHLNLDEDLIVSRDRDADLVALYEALERLAAIDARKARVVEMRFFGGLGVQESAEVLNVFRSNGQAGLAVCQDLAAARIKWGKG